MKRSNNKSKPVALSFYDLPPNFSVPLDRFEKLAAERLQVMVAMEDFRTRMLLKGEDLISKFDELLRNSHLLVADEEKKLDDLLSHWVLALTFSANEESRRRFIQFELDLFKYRFEKMDQQQVASFIETEQVGFEKCSEAEQDAISKEIGMPLSLDDSNGAAAAGGASKSQSFYKVDFTQVCDLVRARRVFLKRGIAYVSQNNLISALAALFKTKLNDKLLAANRTMMYTTKEERMGPLILKLQNASMNSLGADLALVKAGAVTLANVPALAKRSFPLCARELEQALTTPSVQRFMNDSRQQYILFLKGIGLSMDDCMQYFEREFQRKNISAEEFKKRGYGYTVQHNYGQVGKRANYAPWSCVKAVSQHRTAPEHSHGCSFKELSSEKLAIMLRESGITDPAQVRSIQDLAKAGSYQLACRMQWELLHPGGSSDAVGNHPNAWFDASVRYFEEKEAAGKKEGEASAAAATTATGKGD